MENRIVKADGISHDDLLDLVKGWIEDSFKLSLVQISRFHQARAMYFDTIDLDGQYDNRMRFVMDYCYPSIGTKTVRISRVFDYDNDKKRFNRDRTETITISGRKAKKAWDSYCKELIGIPEDSYRFIQDGKQSETGVSVWIS